MRNISSKWIRFSDNSIKSCIGFIDLVDSTKTTITMNNLRNMRNYYSIFINSISDFIKDYNGIIIKNIGDCLLFYFPKTSDPYNIRAFREVVECCFKIIDERHNINEELFRQHLPPFAYRISIDYGMVDFAFVGDYSQIDLFGSTVNLCSKINSSLSIPNEVILGDNMYRRLKSFSSFIIDFDFLHNGEYVITPSTKYSTYNIKRKSYIRLTSREISNIYSIAKKQNPFIEYRNENSYLLVQNNSNKKIIILDDEQEMVLTYKKFLIDYEYKIGSFTDPYLALNYIRDSPNHNDLLVILDVRMKKFNGLQFYQQIKTIDPSIKILFVTALDVIDELLTIIPGLSKEQIMRKPVKKTEFIKHVERLFEL